VIESLHRRLRVDLALYARNGALLAPRAAAAAARARQPLIGAAARRPRTWLLPLRDGRFLVTGACAAPWRPGRWG
jgi:hypothetical protein